MKKQTEYFVSYQFQSKEHNGFGHCAVFYKIKKGDDLIGLQKVIEESLVDKVGTVQVVILYYTKIR